VFWKKEYLFYRLMKGSFANNSTASYCAMVEQQIKKWCGESLFWVAFLKWRLIRLQVTCAKVWKSM